MSSSSFERLSSKIYNDLAVFFFFFFFFFFNFNFNFNFVILNNSKLVQDKSCKNGPLHSLIKFKINKGFIFKYKYMAKLIKYKLILSTL